MKLIQLVYILAVFFVLFNGISCQQKTMPKPYGYFRIDFPQKEYTRFGLNYPYSFEYPTYSKIQPDTLLNTEPFWFTIEVKKNNAQIHISYKKVNNDLLKLTEESRDLAYKHSIKATAINEELFINKEKNVYGTIYEIKGNTASPLQFHLTDSTTHFLRGSFYISEIPNSDSLRPVINFLEKDIYHFIETFNWN